MKSMTHIIAAGGIFAVLSAIAETTPSPAVAADPRIEHGKYLVHQAAMCTDCHTPRNEKGGFIESKHLTGAPIGFKPLGPMPWTPVAPGIAGLPDGYKGEDMIRFLMTGVRPNGTSALPPMPSYRLSREDAEAIATYLQSLQPK
jgi:mono/diheme cytochrome c family protein